MDEPRDADPYLISGVAAAEEGMVFLDGPNGTAVTLTAEAAAETGRSLIEASLEAFRQQRARR